MKPKKLIHYRLGVSRYFPATHPRKGQKTQFVCKVLHAINDSGVDLYEKCSHDCGSSCGRRLLDPKNHTIRANYALWEKRFEKIERGEAVLDLFYWSGKPYNSKQIVFATLTKDDGIGIQKLQFLCDKDGVYSLKYPEIDDNMHVDADWNDLSKNDGLSLEDWKAWFKGCDLSIPLAIIHFTPFRY